MEIGNFTVTEVTDKCFAWCQEQTLIHISNVEIIELSFVAVALVGLVVHTLIHEYSEELRKKGIEETFDMISLGSIYLSYVLLVIFLVRQIFFI